MTKKRVNRQDLTLRNLRALKKVISLIAKRVDQLEKSIRKEKK